MEKINYSLDTNVFTDILRKDRHVIANMERALKNGAELFIDSIVYYEISRWLRFANHPKQLKEFETLYANNLTHIYFDRNDMRVIEKSIEIYNQLRNGRLIEDSDIFIAAIAMVNGCTLVTANEQHFSRIEGLRYVNWRN